MRHLPALLFFLTVCSLSSYSQTYITHVNVTDVVNKKILPQQTVVITGNRITAVGATGKKPLPSNATVIDGTGKYLIPGLTDAHVHFSQSGGLYTRPDAIDLRKFHPYEREIKQTHTDMEELLRRYLQAGITTVVDVGSTYNFLKQRDSFANKSYAPTIYMTGPLLTSYEPKAFAGLKHDSPFRLFTSAEDARKFVQEQLPYHPDFIKIWYIVKPDSVEASARQYQPIIKAIAEEAHKNNLKLAVHATERITAQLAVESGADFLVHDVEDEIVPADFTKLLKSRNVILCPTLTVVDGYYNTFGQKNHFNRYELATSSPAQLGTLDDLKHLPDTAFINLYKQRFNSPAIVANAAREDSIRKINLKKLSDAGVTIVAGTDAGNIGTPHASSLLGELKAMQQAGLSNWQVLQSATINSAKIFNKENSTGSIAAGKTADLVLLNANPVEHLDHLTNIALVFNKGIAIQPDTLISETPEALVQRQLNAYNARNIDAFMDTYSDSVVLYSFPDKLLTKGKTGMRTKYGESFASFPGLHCEIKERIVEGNVVIDKEMVTGRSKTTSGTVIYYIENNKIAKVYFIN